MQQGVKSGKKFVKKSLKLCISYLLSFDTFCKYVNAYYLLISMPCGMKYSYLMHLMFHLVKLISLVKILHCHQTTSLNFVVFLYLTST